MRTGSIYSYKYDGKTYEFFPSRAARCAIQELQTDALESLGDSSSFASVMELQSINKQIEDAKAKKDTEKENELRQRLGEVSMKAMGSLKEITKAQDKSDDEFEIAKILLMNSKAVNGDVSENLAEAILEAMEIELGADKFVEKLLEIYDKVFTMIAEVQDHKKELQTRLKKEQEQTPIPMS